MSNLRPSHCVASVALLNPIDSEHFRDVFAQFDGVTWDLDKTLVGQHEDTLPPAHSEVMLALNALGKRQGLISNASSEHRTSRVLRIADGLSNLLGREIAVVTSRMVGGKKKPLRPAFDKMANNLGLENEQLCHVGDQLLKDVLGANRAGYGGSVLVAPYGLGDDPGVKYLQRPVEALLRPALGLPLLSKDFSKK